MNNKKAYELMINNNIEIPYEVMRIINSKQIFLSSEFASITPEGDYVNINDMRYALGWLVDQFGGKVKWKK